MGRDLIEPTLSLFALAHSMFRANVSARSSPLQLKPTDADDSAFVQSHLQRFNEENSPKVGSKELLLDAAPQGAHGLRQSGPFTHVATRRRGCVRRFDGAGKCVRTLPARAHWAIITSYRLLRAGRAHVRLYDRACVPR
eukprot:5961488-Pleurochrysis_carterae.AAC.1